MAPFDVKAREQSRLRQRESLVRPYRDCGYPWTPLTFFAAPVALTVNLWMDRPVLSSRGLAVILTRHSLLLSLAQTTWRQNRGLRAAILSVSQFRYSIPSCFWICSRGTPLVSGTIVETQRSWRTIMPVKNEKT